jgi:hypothetical protein
VEARFVESGSGKLLYIVNFGDTPLNVRIEVDGRPGRGLYDLRKQQKLMVDLVRLRVGETLIFTLE